MIGHCQYSKKSQEPHKSLLSSLSKNHVAKFKYVIRIKKQKTPEEAQISLRSLGTEIPN